MKKIILAAVALTSVVMMTNSVMAACPVDLPTKLSENLKGKIPLLEITPNGSFDSSCQLNVKYRPCKTAIVTMLRTATIQTVPNCTIESSGTHKHVEDYCLRENVTFSCDSMK